MKISLDWLGQFVDLKKIQPEELARRITEHAFEVEKIIFDKPEINFKNVFVAKVLDWRKHPNADRLRVVKLELKNKIIEPVVCGATNFTAGDMVALALPGSFVPKNSHQPEAKEGLTLEKTTIRGVESQGMICSAFELGLSEKPEEKPEILILSNKYRPGADLKGILTNTPVKRVFDLALPANRPDLFSHLGVARELVGALNLKKLNYFKKFEKYNLPLEFQKKPKLKIDLRSKDCSYYLAVRATVKVNHTPEEILSLLKALGHGGVNNVVDITNYVMHEVGQPLHAFDAEKITGNIIVRKASPDEKIITLDGKQRILSESNLVIADQAKILSLAGIMGGKESSISSTTKEIILESATFDPTSVRLTSKAMALRTDASTVYEKGLHPYQAILGLVRAIELMEKFCHLEIKEVFVSGKPIDKNKKISFSTQQINNLLGLDFKTTEIKRSLSRLNISVKGKQKLIAEIPFYRPDIEDYAGLADELLKTRGLNSILLTAPQLAKTLNDWSAEDLEWQLKEKMVQLGFFEVQNYAFISREDVKKLSLQDHNLVKISNPLNSETEFLKPGLMVPLLKNVSLNQKNYSEFKLFEVGLAYKGYLEEQHNLAFVFFSKTAALEKLIAQAKAVIENLIVWQSGQDIIYKSEFGIITVNVKDEFIGGYGPVPTEFLNGYGIEGNLVYVQFDLEKLLSQKRTKAFKTFSKYPTSTLDISLIADKNLSWSEINRLVFDHGQGLIRDVILFEAPYFYEPANMPDYQALLNSKGKKNLAFHLVYGSVERTLTDSEILQIHAKIIEELKKNLKVEVR